MRRMEIIRKGTRRMGVRKKWGEEGWWKKQRGSRDDDKKGSDESKGDSEGKKNEVPILRCVIKYILYVKVLSSPPKSNKMIGNDFLA